MIAFSAILNLGILARQRSQVIPFFLALLVVWGRKHTDEDDEVPIGETKGQPQQLELAGSPRLPQRALTLVQSGPAPVGSPSPPRH